MKNRETTGCIDQAASDNLAVSVESAADDFEGQTSSMIIIGMDFTPDDLVEQSILVAMGKNVKVVPS